MRRQFTAGLAMLAALGCSKEPFPLASVSGTVTLNGAPLPNAMVTFQPIGTLSQDPGPGSTGRTDAEGRYTLRTVAVSGKRRGAVVGWHRVSITTQSGAHPQDTPDGQAPPPEIVPSRYNTQTGLKFEVPAGGTDEADFALTTP